MSIFDRYFRPGGTAPEWARFFSDSEYSTFLYTVEAELTRRALPFEFGNGVIKVRMGPGEPNHLGLQNLAQLCHREAPERWQALIGEHLDNILKSNRESAEIETLEASYDRVRDKVKVRLYAAGYGAEVGEQLIHRTVAEGVEAAVVYDLPSSVRSVAKARTDAWGVTEDDLFRLGLENVAHESPPERRVVEVGGGAHIEALIGDSFFTTSHALRLEAFLDRPAHHGVLVAMPHRHAVLFHPIRDMRVVSAINGLISMTFGMFQEGPGSLSPHLYWWHHGKLIRLPSEVSANRLTFTPPDEFVAVLNELSGGPPRGPMN